MSGFEILGVIAIAIGGLVLAARALERQTQRHGTMLSRPPTKSNRLVAFLLSILFGLWFLVDLFAGGGFVMLWPPILSAILLLYALTGHKLINESKSSSEINKEQEK